MIGSTLVMAVREVRRNTMRSILTGLGIVIGVAAVILMVTIGDSASRKVTIDIGKLGSNLLIVMPGSERRGPIAATAPPLTSADAAAIAAAASAVGQVAPAASKSVLAVVGNHNHNTLATGSTNAYFGVRSYAIARGRAFTDAELQAGALACVIGETVRRELFRNQDPLGATLRVDRLSCTVVGVLVSKGSATLGGDQDDLIVMPLLAVQRRLTGSTDLGAVFVSAIDERSTTRAKTQIEQLLRQRRRIQPGQADDFMVQDMKEITKTLGTVTGILTALLAAIAAVSLLVGGIGIMNIMLVSVTERTREIGIRLSIGALGREVLFQFLVEAVVLSTLGGLIGLVAGLVGSALLCSALGLPFAIVPWVVVLAVAFSVAVGVGFGYFPARRAAALDPIEALRHE
ncbi:MAG: ABC transporter permease [Myxococcales bacterium]|nr:ABC transporter permease [Myxococcales bacterium]MBK7195228.1 ABC transporter permease [Myxococcales bacterium]